MKKTSRKALRLSRETLRRLECREIRPVLGGTVQVDDRLTGDTCLCMTYDPCDP